MLSRIRVILMFVVAVMLSPHVAFAHPGHGSVESGPAHYVLEPVHAVAIAAAFGIAIALTGFAVMCQIQRKAADS